MINRKHLNLLRAGKPSQIQSAMEAGAGSGMQTLEQALVDGVMAGMLEEETARAAAREPQIFAERLKHARSTRPTQRGAAAFGGGGSAAAAFGGVAWP